MTTISALLPDFRDYLAHERRLQPATLQSYSTDLRTLNAFIEDVPVIDITKTMLRAYMRHMSKQGLSSLTIRRKFHCYRTFWNWLRLCEIDDRLLPEQIPLPKRRRKQPTWLTDSQLKTFVQTLDGDPLLDLAWMILAMLGLRRGELLALRWDDFDMESQKVTIQPGKGGRARILHYPNALQSRLDNLKSSIDGNPTGDILGFRHTKLTKHFNEHLKACNLDGHSFTMHSLRHSFASHLISRGVDITIVKELLGHKDITHTMIYVHHQPEQYRDAINQHILSNEETS